MSAFLYRRELTRRDLLPAPGVGLGAGVAAAYIAQLLLRRARLASAPSARAGDAPVVPTPAPPRR